MLPKSYGYKCFRLVNGESTDTYENPEELKDVLFDLIACNASVTIHTVDADNCLTLTLS